MSDKNLTDALNNIMKKTKFFEKLDKIQFYVGSFVLFSSIIGIAGIFIQYSNINNNKKIIDKIELKYNENLHHLNNKISDLEYKLVYLMDNQQNYLDKIKHSPLIIIGKQENISTSSSISSLIDLSKKNINEQNEENKQKCKIEQKDIIEDDELINECYDIIPLNNNKKITGIKRWLF